MVSLGSPCVCAFGQSSRVSAGEGLGIEDSVWGAILHRMSDIPFASGRGIEECNCMRRIGSPPIRSVIQRRPDEQKDIRCRVDNTM